MRYSVYCPSMAHCDVGPHLFWTMYQLYNTLELEYLPPCEVSACLRIGLRRDCLPVWSVHSARSHRPKKRPMPCALQRECRCVNSSPHAKSALLSFAHCTRVLALLLVVLISKALAGADRGFAGRAGDAA